MISQSTQIDYLLESTVKTESGAVNTAAPAGSFSKELDRAVSNKTDGGSRAEEKRSAAPRRQEPNRAQQARREDSENQPAAPAKPVNTDTGSEKVAPIHGERETKQVEASGSKSPQVEVANEQPVSDTSYPAQDVGMAENQVPLEKDSIRWALMQHISGGGKMVSSGLESLGGKTESLRSKVLEKISSVGEKIGSDMKTNASGDSDGTVDPLSKNLSPEKKVSGTRKELDFFTREKDENHPFLKDEETAKPNVDLFIKNAGLEKGKPSFLKGSDLVNEIRSFFMNSGVPTDNFTVNDEGLDSLKDLLVGMGFSEDSVTGMIDDLKIEAGEGKEVKLTSILGELEELSSPEMSEDDSFFLDVSTIPFIRDALKGLGVSEEDAGSLIQGSMVDGSGISLLKLSGEIQELAEKTPTIANTTQEKTAGDDARRSLEKIGIVFDNPENKQLTLTDFASRIESIVNEKIGVRSEKEPLVNNIKGFFENIKADKSIVPANSAQNSITDQEIAKVSSNQAFPGRESLGGEKDLKGPLTSMAAESASSTAASKVPVPEETRKVDSDGDRGVRSQDRRDAMISRTVESAGGNPGDKGNLGAGSQEQGAGKNLLQGDLRPSEEVKSQATSFDRVAEETGIKQTPKATQAAATPVKTLPAYVLNQVGRQIQHSVQQGENEVKLQINPPRMGKVLIEIESTTGGLRISMTTEQNTAKDLLQTHAHELKSTLADQGIRIEKVDVQLSSNFDQFSGGTKQQQEQAKNRKNGSGNRNKRDKNISGTGQVEESVGKNTPLSSGHGLHMVA